jgi:hypothetical protein
MTTRMRSVCNAELAEFTSIGCLVEQIVVDETIRFAAYAEESRNFTTAAKSGYLLLEAKVSWCYDIERFESWLFYPFLGNPNKRKFL